MNCRENVWYVYLLGCSDHTLYCGITTDIDKRVKTHNNGHGSKYTRCRLPVRLVYLEKAGNRSSALKREAKIKRMTRIQKLELTVEHFSEMEEDLKKDMRQA